MVQKFIMSMHRTILTFLKITAVFSMAMLINSCGTARLAYSNGETLSYWWLDGYIDISPEQSPQVKEELANLFAWHRKTQLPDYIQWLRSAQRRMQRNVTLADLRRDGTDVTQRLHRLTDQAAPGLADLARSLQPAQLAQLQKKFNSNNEKFRKDFMRGDAEQRQQQRFKKVLEQAEYWFGEFSAEQEAIIRAASDSRLLNPEWVLAERIRRQAGLVTLLQRIQSEKASRDEAARLIAEYLNQDGERGATPERKEFFERLQEANLQMTMVIINSTTPVQRSKATARAQQWIDDFSALARG